MDAMDLGSLNWWAIIVAIVFNQVLGAVWYSTLAKPWMAEVGLTRRGHGGHEGHTAPVVPVRTGDRARVRLHLALALLGQGLDVDSFGEGLGLGVLAAVGFVVTSNGINYAFEGRSFRLLAINAGYPLVSYSVIGVLLALWQ